jgi:hypothetical protein
MEDRGMANETIVYTRPLYQTIASLVDARIRCEQNATAGSPQVMDGDQDVTRAHWLDMAGQHRARVDQLVSRYLPSGSGWDNGTKLDYNMSNANRLVFHGSFHHMNDNGFYDGWTDHQVIVTASLTSGIDVRVTGRNRNDIKDYLAEMFQHMLTQEMEG